MRTTRFSWSSIELSRDDSVPLGLALFARERASDCVCCDRIQHALGLNHFRASRCSLVGSHALSFSGCFVLACAASHCTSISLALHLHCRDGYGLDTELRGVSIHLGTRASMTPWFPSQELRFTVETSCLKCTTSMVLDVQSRGNSVNHGLALSCCCQHPRACWDTWIDVRSLRRNDVNVEAFGASVLVIPLLPWITYAYLDSISTNFAERSSVVP
jgi:hypothetical protein